MKFKSLILTLAVAVATTATAQVKTGIEVLRDNGFAQLKGKKVGFVVREEEYLKSDGSVGVSRKPFRFCTYDKAEQQEIPKKKTLSPSAGFTAVADDFSSDAGLPFN